MRQVRRHQRLWPRRNSDDAIAERQAALRRLSTWSDDDEFVFEFPAPIDRYRRAQECLTGWTLLPVGVVGPLRLNLGAYRVDDRGDLIETGRSDEQVHVPLAHTEGGLSASMLRGMAVAAESGGVRTYVVRDRITRDSAFVFRTVEDALAFAGWIRARAPAMRRWLRDPANPLRAQTVGGVPRLSRHARLWEVDTHVVGTHCHVLYRYTAGDACGPNMITRNTYALNTAFVTPRLEQDLGIAPLRIVLEANMGGDKKPSHHYFEGGGHGKSVLAEVRPPDAVLRRLLRVSADDLLALTHVGTHGGHASGMQTVGFTPASAIAAIFACTGQDIGMVGTSSMAHGVVDRAGDGLVVSLRLPTLEVGTVGGGTGLPHARAYLGLMGCRGEGSAYRLAQIVAAATLCLELSASASMATAGGANFAEAHTARGGRAP